MLNDEGKENSLNIVFTKVFYVFKSVLNTTVAGRRLLMVADVS